jgi:enoyl-CoA hydratase/carnithine racemase
MPAAGGVMPYDTLGLHLDGPVARIKLARPKTSNRIDGRCIAELSSACESIGGDPDVRVTLLTAEGADFCCGWAEGARESFLESKALDPFGPLAQLACPVVAAIQGAATGAGLELTLAADIRIASDGARFRLPDNGQSALPVAGGTQRLLRLVGRALATRMLLLGDELDAAEAYRAGLVSRVVPESSLPDEAERVASRISAWGPLALRYAKEAVLQGGEMSLDQALRYELDLSVVLQTTRDRAEGVQAFMEKRPPEFNGR